MVAVKNKSDFILIEVKSKARMNRRAETGIDYKNFIYYKKACEQHNFRLFLTFVDEFTGSIYGNYLDILEEPHKENNITYPYNETFKKEIRFYPLSKMITLARLSDLEIERLKSHSTRNYNYG